MKDIAVQVARLRTIEDVHALGDQAREDYRAGIIDDDIFCSAMEVARLAMLELSVALVVEGGHTRLTAP